MNRIDYLFQTKKERILSIYVTAGFPNLEDTLPVMEAIQAAGADIIEIGLPYSDPIADGPTIQESNTIALENGMSIKKLFFVFLVRFHRFLVAFLRFFGWELHFMCCFSLV